MTTQTEAITNAIITRLTNAGITTRATTGQPYSYEDAGILVDVSSEAPSGVWGGAGGYVYWDLDVILWVSASGANPKLAPETLRQTAHVALYTDRTFGGLAMDIRAGGVRRQIDSDNPAKGLTQATYTIQYRVGESTL